MDRHRPRRSLRRAPAPPVLLARLAAALAGATLAAACDIPNFQGPQVQTPPPAFTMNREVTQERRMFPDRAVVYHDAWVEASWGDFSGIYINGHPAVLGPDEVEAARRGAMAAAAGKRVQFGELESLQVDGRTAWGWGETWLLDNGGLQYVVFRAAVPYDTITYAVDFLTGEPGLKARPDSLRTIVASFAVGRTTVNWPLILIAAGVVLFLGNLARRRSQERAARHRSVPLATIPKRDAGKPGGQAGGAPGVPAPGAAAAPGRTAGPAVPANLPSAAPGGAADTRADGSVARQIQIQLSQKKRPPEA